MKIPKASGYTKDESKKKDQLRSDAKSGGKWRIIHSRDPVNAPSYFFKGKRWGKNKRTEKRKGSKACFALLLIMLERLRTARTRYSCRSPGEERVIFLSFGISFPPYSE